jgi:hypothetical protein
MVGTVIGLVVLAFIAVYTFGFIWTFLFEFIPTTYRAIRYERHGVCGKCHERYVHTTSRSVDQTYGADRVTQDVCPNGHVSLVHGNRHHADWAGF